MASSSRRSARSGSSSAATACQKKDFVDGGVAVHPLRPDLHALRHVATETRSRSSRRSWRSACSRAQPGDLVITTTSENDRGRRATACRLARRPPIATASAATPYVYHARTRSRCTPRTSSRPTRSELRSGGSSAGPKVNESPGERPRADQDPSPAARRFSARSPRFSIRWRC